MLAADARSCIAHTHKRIEHVDVARHVIETRARRNEARRPSNNPALRSRRRADTLVVIERKRPVNEFSPHVAHAKRRRIGTFGDPGFQLFTLPEKPDHQWQSFSIKAEYRRLSSYRILSPITGGLSSISHPSDTNPCRPKTNRSVRHSRHIPVSHTCSCFICAGTTQAFPDEHTPSASWSINDLGFLCVRRTEGQAAGREKYASYTFGLRRENTACSRSPSASGIPHRAAARRWQSKQTRFSRPVFPPANRRTAGMFQTAGACP